MLNKIKNMKQVFGILFQPFIDPKTPEHKFVVYRREVWIQPVEITATSKAEALDKVADGQGDYFEDRLEYSHTLDDHEHAKIELSEKDELGEFHDKVHDQLLTQLADNKINRKH